MAGDRLNKASADDDEVEVSRLENIRPAFVSLVDFGANWGGQRHHFVLKRDVAKAVPDQGATSEDKEAARAARSKQYGIQVLESGSNLSYPADGPTRESLYADPVNLKYPLGYASNERDAGRIRNALARFKQNAATYTEDASRGRVYERIVRAALAEDIAVSYDPADPVDALLPADLKDRLSKAASAPPSGPTPADRARRVAMQARILDVQGQILAITKVHPVATDESAHPVASVAEPVTASDPGADRVAQLERDNARLMQDLATMRTERQADRARLARLSKSTGRMSGHRVTNSPQTPAERDAYPLDYNDSAWSQED
jgi:hypothetical protein